MEYWAQDPNYCGYEMEIQQGTGEGGWVRWGSANRHEAPIQIGAKLAGPADFGRPG